MCDQEMPQSVLSVFVSNGDAIQRQYQHHETQRTGSDPSPNNYCNPNSSYDFHWSDTWKYFFKGCMAPFPAQLADKGPLGSSYFFKTAFISTLFQRFENPEGNRTDEHCMVIFSEQPEDMRQDIICLPQSNQTKEYLKHAYYSDYYIEHYTHQERFLLTGSNSTMCCCTAITGGIYVGVDDLILSVDHFFYSQRVTGGLTKTYIRKIGTTSNKKVFEAGDTLSMTLSQILEWSEVELDKRADEGLNAQWLEGSSEAEVHALQGPTGVEENKFPYVRISGLHVEVGAGVAEEGTVAAGLRVEVVMEYYNHRLVPGDVHSNDEANLVSPDNSDANTVCVMYFRPYLVWTSEGNDFSVQSEYSHYDSRELDVYRDHYNYGVLVSFTAGGLIGGFDTFLLISVITQMIVMLGFSGQITTIIARNMLGSKSVLYKSVISERLDALSIYGRFASQAITASLCYDIFDGNGSGRLSKPEIYEQLSKLFHRSMSKTQMATLVEFVMYMAEITHIPKLARGQSEEEEEEEMDLDNNSEDEEDAAELLQQETSAGRKMSILPVQKRTRNGTKSHVTRNQWVSVFTGPPCSLQQCINVIDRKSEQRLAVTAVLLPIHLAIRQAAADTAIQANAMVPRSSDDNDRSIDVLYGNDDCARGILFIDAKRYKAHVWQRLREISMRDIAVDEVDPRGLEEF
eukprot:gene2181-2886_t